jgi:hypothetical protein
MLSKIVSGGQTGVDRAALDVALAQGIPCGGWCPLGRRAEDGRLPDRYPLHETPSDSYEQRSEWNVRDSDGTLILARGPLEGGTKLTFDYATHFKKPWLRVDLEEPPATDDVVAWLARYQVTVLNVAGPRESESPGIYAAAIAFLRCIVNRG